MSDRDEPEAGRDQCVTVFGAVGSQTDRGAAVEIGPAPVHKMEVGPTLDEQHRIGHAPYALVEHDRLGASRDQCNAVAVLSHPAQPLDRLTAKRRVKPDPRFVRSDEAAAGFD